MQQFFTLGQTVPAQYACDGTVMLCLFSLALLSSVCFSFIVYIVSYIDIGAWPALMELILPLATCHCTSHCVMILLLIILTNKFSLLSEGSAFAPCGHMVADSLSKTERKKSQINITNISLDIRPRSKCAVALKRIDWLLKYIFK